jgi:regulator of sigma E protease
MPTKFKQIPPPDESRSLSTWSLVFVAGIAVTLVMGQWTLLVAILGLAFLITVHEFGHFIAAKKLGMQVEKFYVGFPPAAWKKKWGETEYGIGIIPLGGFCKISGMTPEEEVPEGTGDRVYWKAPVWKRNLAIFAGPLMNFVAAAVILFGALLIQGQAAPNLTIDTVVAGKPAASVGLQPGDTLVGADGVRWSDWDEASSYLAGAPGKTIRLTYVPGAGADAGEEKTVAVTLGTNPNAPDQGFLGVSPEIVSERPSVARAAWLSLVGLKDVTWGVFYGFYLLGSGAIDVTGDEGAMGVVGIMDVSGDAVRQGWYPILLALLSANLGIINLLPILPFDGGHILFNTVERIRGRRLSPKVLERVVAVGVTLLILLFVFLTFNDLQRIFG